MRAKHTLKVVYNSSRDKPTSVLLDRFSPIIYINGEVNPKMAEDFIRALNEIENTRNTDAALIKIDSIGGSITDCFKIINAIKSSHLTIATYCIGAAYSAAAVILSAGNKGMRFTAPLSHHMIHSTATVIGGRIEAMRSDMHSVEQINHMVFAELASNCGKSVKAIEDAIRHTGSTDLFLTPWEAKSFGLVDIVANVALAKSESYHLQVDAIEDPDKPKKTKKPQKEKTSITETISSVEDVVKTEAPISDSKPKRTGRKVTK